MSSTAQTPPQPTHDRWHQEPVNKDLFPYRVKYGDKLYTQETFLEADKRYYNFTSGVGAGKTVSGLLRVARNVQEWNPGETGMIVAPTVPALKNVILPELRKWNFLNDWEFRGKGSEDPGLHAPNGARIILESADNDRKIERLRGPSIAWFWIDEAAQVSKKAWDVLVSRLRTGQYRNGFITTTPKGYNWVYDRFVDTEDDAVANILGVPSHANPFTPEDYRRDIVEEHEGTYYQQEVLGEFTSFEGLVYPWFSSDHVVEESPEPGEYDEVIYAVDWGHANPSVALALVRQGDRWTVVEEWYERRCTVNDHATALEALVSRWGEGPIYCDPAEPANIETFRRNSLPAHKAENAVTPGIQHIASLRDELRVVSTCQNLRNEFNQYQYKDDGDSDDPLKKHDHAMDALRYALFTHSQGTTTAEVRRRSARDKQGHRRFVSR